MKVLIGILAIVAAQEGCLEAMRKMTSPEGMNDLVTFALNSGKRVNDFG